MVSPTVIAMDRRSPPDFNGTGPGFPPGNGINGPPKEEDHTALLALRGITLFFSLLGMIGNGIVLWFLCLRIPRTQFTVYILNLALADFIVVLCSFPTLLFVLCHPWKLDASPITMQVLLTMRIMHIFVYNTSLYLLTAISVERCLSVFQPIWYKCRRPPNQSIVVCIMLWVLSCLLTAPEFFTCDKEMYKLHNKKCSAALITSFGCGFAVFTPIMVMCSLSLLCKVRRSSQQRQPLKLYAVIAVTVLVFLITTVPPRLMDLLLYFKVLPPGAISFFSAQHASMLCSAINVCANPVIYVFVGGLWKKRGQKPIQEVLHSVFKSELELTEHEERASN